MFDSESETAGEQRYARHYRRRVTKRVSMRFVLDPLRGLLGWQKPTTGHRNHEAERIQMIKHKVFAGLVAIAMTPGAPSY